MGLSTGDVLAIILGSVLAIIIIGYLVYILLFQKKKMVSLYDIEMFINLNPQYNNVIMGYIKNEEPVKTETDKLYGIDLTKTPRESVTRPSKDLELNEVFKDTQTTPTR